MTQNNEYRTSDLYYAAYLKVAGVKLVKTERENGRVYFIFEDSTESADLRDLKDQYFNRTSKVPALSLCDEIKAMKSLTHDTP